MKLSRPELRIANFGDIHFGHRQTPTDLIIRNLDAVLPDNAETAALDMILFTGDIFDLLMTLSNGYVPMIQVWIARVLRIAKKYDIVVRILKGTPGHDWEQSQLFENVNAIADIGADLKYVKEISIEYIERYGITMLYVPDEANSTTEKTLSQVRELMRAKGLDKVDFAMMHGQFEFQLPAHVPAQKHDSAAYLELVREIIMIGHHHIHSRYDRILAPGSTDRLKHGEEGPKGHLRILARRDATYDIQFVENVGAKKYITVPCCGLPMEETWRMIREMVRELPDDSYVRVEVDSDNPILSNKEEMIRQFPLLNMSVIARKEKKEEDDAPAEAAQPFDQVTLTPENLSELLMARLTKVSTNNAVLAAARALIEEVK